MSANTGGAAFPCKVAVDGGINGYVDVDAPGMTLRDWFAGKAMQGMFANGELTERSDWNPLTAAVAAYAIADAMIQARGDS